MEFSFENCVGTMVAAVSNSVKSLLGIVGEINFTVVQSISTDLNVFCQ